MKEALKLALEALKQIDEAMPFPVAKLAIMEAEKALSQPQRKPLTDEQICPWFQENTALTNEAAMRITRAIEAAHGIKE